MDDRTPARPTACTPALADAVCAAVARGESLLQACAQPGMPERATVFDWAEADAAFAKRLEAARLRAVETFADDILALADGFGLTDKEQPKTPAARLQRDRMRIAVRQWLMAKRDPARWGRGGAARPLSLFDDAPEEAAAPEAPAEDPKVVAAQEFDAWDLAEADARVIEYEILKEWKAAAESALASGGPAPLTIPSALLGGRAIPLAPLLAADGRTLDPEAINKLHMSRLHAIYEAQQRPAAERRTPPPQVVEAALANLDWHYVGYGLALPTHKRGYIDKFTQILHDMANAWPEEWADTAPPPI